MQLLASTELDVGNGHSRFFDCIKIFPCFGKIVICL